MTTSALFTIVALFTSITKAALTDCGGPSSETCICVWNLIIAGGRVYNGLYRIADNTKTGLDREWIMDDIRQWTKCSSPTNYKMFWYWDIPINEANNRWYLGDSSLKETNSGFCFCSTGPGQPDPTQDQCNAGNYYCTSTGWPQTQYNDATNGATPNLIDVKFGQCQTLKDYCTTIKVTAAAPYDFCNGIYYNYDHQIAGLDNEMNIYRNMNDSLANRYIYFDQTQFTWVCSGKYDPCSINYGTIPDKLRNNSYVGDIYYRGADNDPGTPAFTTIRNNGEEWTVSEWGHSSDPNGVATFQCNPPTPTPAPVTAQPTLGTTSPTPAPTNNPSPAPTGNPTIAPQPAPTSNPSPAPTDHPNVGPSKSPTPSPTSQPTPAPTSNPTPAPTSNPTPAPTSQPTPAPTGNPTPSPTGNPLAADETAEPSTTPTTPYPTKTPTTDEPSGSPTNIPTDVTEMPTRSPLPVGKTHPPTTGTPSKAPITPYPTDITFNPTTSPLTRTPTKSPTAYQRDPEDEETETDKASIHWTGITALVSFIVYLLFI